MHRLCDGSLSDTSMLPIASGVQRRKDSIGVLNFVQRAVLKILGGRMRQAREEQRCGRVCLPQLPQAAQRAAFAEG